MRTPRFGSRASATTARSWTSSTPLTRRVCAPTARSASTTSSCTTPRSCRRRRSNSLGLPPRRHSAPIMTPIRLTPRSRTTTASKSLPRPPAAALVGPRLAPRRVPTLPIGSLCRCPTLARLRQHGRPTPLCGSHRPVSFRHRRRPLQRAGTRPASPWTCSRVSLGWLNQRRPRPMLPGNSRPAPASLSRQLCHSCRFARRHPDLLGRSVRHHLSRQLCHSCRFVS